MILPLTAFFNKILSVISMEKFLNHLAICPHHLYNMMHGIPETAEYISIPPPFPVAVISGGPAGAGGRSAVYTTERNDSHGY